MANANTTILCEKGVIPISLGEFCQHLGESYRIAGADSSVMISSIVAGGNEDVKNGSLFIPYKESDKQIMDIVARGAAVVLTDHAIEGVPCIVVGDVMQAVYHLCYANGFTKRSLYRRSSSAAVKERPRPSGWSTAY